MHYMLLMTVSQSSQGHLEQGEARVFRMDRPAATLEALPRLGPLPLSSYSDIQHSWKVCGIGSFVVVTHMSFTTSTSNAMRQMSTDEYITFIILSD